MRELQQKQYKNNMLKILSFLNRKIYIVGSDGTKGCYVLISFLYFLVLYQKINLVNPILAFCKKNVMYVLDNPGKMRSLLYTCWLVLLHRKGNWGMSSLCIFALSRHHQLISTVRCEISNLMQKKWHSRRFFTNFHMRTA